MKKVWRLVITYSNGTSESMSFNCDCYTLSAVFMIAERLVKDDHDACYRILKETRK